MCGIPLNIKSLNNNPYPYSIGIGLIQDCIIYIIEIYLKYI